MFLGLSPFDALAMYSLITYADLALGMWFPEGRYLQHRRRYVDTGAGDGRCHPHLPPRGADLRGAGRVEGVMLASGEQLRADLVVSNADLPYTYRNLIAPSDRKGYSDERLEQMQYACSGFILYLGVDKTYSAPAPPGAVLLQDYRANLDAIFKTKTLPQEPSFHLSIPTVTDPSLAPPGHSLIYVLAPMPNLEAKIDWDTGGTAGARKAARTAGAHRRPRPAPAHCLGARVSPGDWLLTSTPRSARHSVRCRTASSNLRIFDRTTKPGIQGLYFVGQGTYPGIGMPMVMISSRLVTERIAQNGPEPRSRTRRACCSPWPMPQPGIAIR